MGSLRYRDIFQLLSVPRFPVPHLPLAISRLPACTSHFRMGVAAVDVVVAAGSQGGSTFNCRRKPFGLSRLDSCRSCRSTLEGSEVLSSTVLSQFTITFAFVSDFVSLTISLSLWQGPTSGSTSTCCWPATFSDNFRFVSVGVLSISPETKLNFCFIFTQNAEKAARKKPKKTESLVRGPVGLSLLCGAFCYQSFYLRVLFMAKIKGRLLRPSQQQQQQRQQQ